MNTVIFKGSDALKAAKYVQDNGLCQAYDLGPDFGENAARLWLPEHEVDGPQRWISIFERWRDVNHWFDAVGADWRVVFDGPPYRMGGNISVEGTPM
jgi:hypothetical protein